MILHTETPVVILLPQVFVTLAEWKGWSGNKRFKMQKAARKMLHSSGGVVIVQSFQQEMTRDQAFGLLISLFVQEECERSIASMYHVNRTGMHSAT